MPTLSPVALEDFCADILSGAGMRADDASEVARHLVAAEMKNIVSHGVNRVAYYLELFADDGLQPVGEVTLERTGPTVVQADGGKGLGIVAMERVVDELIAMASGQPIVCAAIRNVGHTGRMGAYAERLAENGLFAMSFGGGNAEKWPQVAAHGGRGGALSTNPWAIALPGGDAGDISADFATCVVANGKIRIRRRTGEPVPEGWIADARGRTTTSIDDYDNGGALLPAGGHKGYGFALIAEMVGRAMMGEPFEFNWIVIALRTDGDRSAGMMSDLTIAPQNRSIVIGHIWFAPFLQKTRAATSCVAFPTSHDAPSDRPLGTDNYELFPQPFNATGQPAVSVPCGFTKAGLPFGLEIVGRAAARTRWSCAQAALSRPPIRSTTCARLSADGLSRARVQVRRRGRGAASHPCGQPPSAACSRASRVVRDRDAAESRARSRHRDRR
ncbi:MAG: Ldh family oxidoreductase [Rhodospirillales bacterium]|nr:Ldh family oxidoreductase [Rhodospirillales bacterium]